MAFTSGVKDWGVESRIVHLHEAYLLILGSQPSEHAKMFKGGGVLQMFGGHGPPVPTQSIVLKVSE